MPRYLFAVRHPAYAELEDDMCGMELPDHAAARELAAKVMQGLLRNQDEDWRGWTMEVRLDGRWVWHLPFDAIPGRPLIKLSGRCTTPCRTRCISVPVEGGRWGAS